MNNWKSRAGCPFRQKRHEKQRNKSVSALSSFGCPNTDFWARSGWGKMVKVCAFLAMLFLAEYKSEAFLQIPNTRFLPAKNIVVTRSCIETRNKAPLRVRVSTLGDLRMSRGDSALAQSVSALISGEIQSAVEFLTEARNLFIQEGLLDARDDLLREVAARVQQEQAKRKINQPTQMEPRSKEKIMLKQEGDMLMASAANAVGRRDFIAARELLDKASKIFDSAGYEVRRDREAIVGNMYSSILIEEAREEAQAKQRAKREKEEKLHREALQLLRPEKSEDPFDPNTSALEATGYGLLDGEDVCILVDNGSSLPQTTLHLRRIARRLSDRVGIKVRPRIASLLLLPQSEWRTTYWPRIAPVAQPLPCVQRCACVRRGA
jgi:hypothetical protein